MNTNVVEVPFRSDSRPLLPALTGDSPATRRLRRLAMEAGASDAPVLVTGESGCGKEFLARLIHGCRRRSQGPFVTFNCEAIPPGQLEAELLGSENRGLGSAVQIQRGAIERAGRGTVYLGEITGMPPGAQEKFSRVLETGRIRRTCGSIAISCPARIIVACGDSGALADPLRSLVRLHIAVPALRERDADVLVLAQEMVDGINLREGSSKHLSQSSRELLRAYGWPGNVRELKHCIERAFAGGGDELELRPQAAPARAAAADGRLDIRVGSSIEQAERLLIEATLQHFRGNKRRTADALGCSLKTLYNKLHSYARTEHQMANG